MDKQAAEQYLNQIYGTDQGYVAVAYKDKGSSWQECQFQWPQEKRKLIGWAEVHQDANIFICPALRKDAHTRKKGDMQPSRWLWADVDWQGVPEAKRAEVDQRIADLGSFVVGSGSGNNLHVYVHLTSAVPADKFAKLNTGLRDYLYADNKQADNSLLRLPGTTNWKTEKGSVVSFKEGNGKKHSPAVLMKRRAFRDAKVVTEDVVPSDWVFTEVEGLSRRMKAKLNMPVDEARGRYGNRHNAVNAIVKDLHRAGFDSDHIHSMLHKFPAGLDKMAEENGYDLHLDIDRCLARVRVIEEEIEEILEGDDDMPEVTEEEFLQETIDEGVAKELLRRSIKKAADKAEAERGWVGPPDDASWSLTEALSNPPRPVPHLIQGLAGEKHNVVITAQYKVGKTDLVIGSLARALADGLPFLDHFDVNVPKRTKSSIGGVVVGHWNCEMDPAEMLDDYIRPTGYENPTNLHVANLRGYPVNLLTDMGRQWAVEWLRKRQVKVWTIDSLARLMRMAGVSEKDNDEVMGLLMALDQIKVEAGVDVLFLIAHTGRMQHEEGNERARGATAIDDWCDARWIMTKMDKTRFLRVEGRGVALDDTALVYEPETKRYSLGFGGKEEVKNDGGVQTIVRMVRENPGCTQAELYRLLKNTCSQRLAKGFIDEAADAGFIEVKTVASGRGKPALRHYLCGYEKPEGDRVRRATPADVDLRDYRSTRRRSYSP